MERVAPPPPPPLSPAPPHQLPCLVSLLKLPSAVFDATAYRFCDATSCEATTTTMGVGPCAGAQRAGRGAVLAGNKQQWMSRDSLIGERSCFSISHHAGSTG